MSRKARVMSDPDYRGFPLEGVRQKDHKTIRPENCSFFPSTCPIDSLIIYWTTRISEDARGYTQQDR